MTPDDRGQSGQVRLVFSTGRAPPFPAFDEGSMASVFFSYSHKGEELRDRLKVALATLKRQGLIETWHDRMLRAGDEFDPGIRE